MLRVLFWLATLIFYNLAYLLLSYYKEGSLIEKF